MVKKRFRVTIEDKVYEVEVEVEDILEKVQELRNLFSNDASRSMIIPKETRVQESISTIVHKGEITAPITGRVISIRVKEGDKVNKGNVLLVLESMKTQIEIKSPLEGIVKRVLVKEGESVKQHQRLIIIE